MCQIDDERYQQKDSRQSQLWSAVSVLATGGVSAAFGTSSSKDMFEAMTGSSGNWGPAVSSYIDDPSRWDAGVPYREAHPFHMGVRLR